jgi:hypothetical protein
MPFWVDVIVKLTPAFVTLVIGMVASGIAFFQFRTAQDKLRLDLFSKRLEAFEKLQEFFTSVLRTGTVESQTLPLLAEARYKSRFLFGPEIEASFDVLWMKATNMMTLRSRLYGTDAIPAGFERSAFCAEEDRLLAWMMEDMKVAPSRYSKYLQFK